jgi:V-type H+-transporting ATPase subunit D
VSGKKQRDAAVEEAARLAKKDDEDSEKAQEDAAESKDLLGDEDNQDVIF